LFSDGRSRNSLLFTQAGLGAAAAMHARFLLQLPLLLLLVCPSALVSGTDLPASADFVGFDVCCGALEPPFTPAVTQYSWRMDEWPVPGESPGNFPQMWYRLHAGLELRAFDDRICMPPGNPNGEYCRDVQGPYSYMDYRNYIKTMDRVENAIIQVDVLTDWPPNGFLLKRYEVSLHFPPPPPPPEQPPPQVSTVEVQLYLEDWKQWSLEAWLPGSAGTPPTAPTPRNNIPSAGTLPFINTSLQRLVLRDLPAPIVLTASLEFDLSARSGVAWPPLDPTMLETLAAWMDSETLRVVAIAEDWAIQQRTQIASAPSAVDDDGDESSGSRRNTTQLSWSFEGDKPREQVLLRIDLPLLLEQMQVASRAALIDARDFQYLMPPILLRITLQWIPAADPVAVPRSAVPTTYAFSFCVDGFPQAALPAQPPLPPPPSPPPPVPPVPDAPAPLSTSAGATVFVALALLFVCVIVALYWFAPLQQAYQRKGLAGVWDELRRVPHENRPLPSGDLSDERPETGRAPVGPADTLDSA